MNELLVVAWASFRDAVRDKVLYSLVFLTGLLIAFSAFLGELSVFDAHRTILNVSLGTLSIAGLGLAVFVGIGLVQREIQRRTILPLLARPVSRTQVLVGKYFGLLGVLAVLAVGLGLIIALLLTVRGMDVPMQLVPAVWGIFLEMAVVTAVALLFSTFSSPVLAALLTLGVWMSGHLSGDIVQYVEVLQRNAERLPGVSPPPWWLEGAAHTAFVAIPNLDLFNLRHQAAHALAIPSSQILWTTFHAVLWCTILLLVASLWFRRRDFH